MKKLLTVAAFLLCLAGSLYAEGYLYPTGPGGGPPQSCPGCPAPRTSDNTSTLANVWPYADPIVGFHRYLDSLWIKDWQQPIRTARAFRTWVVPSRNRIYMRIGGGMLAAYDMNEFPKRLARREELMAGARRTTLTGAFEGYDLYLRPDKYFYAENKSTGWTTPITDGQERLMSLDYDDRGYVYMAYSHFGWGIAKDNGTNDGNLMQNVKQMYGDVTNNIAPNNIFVLKVNNRYYAFVFEQGQGQQMQVWDVTTPEAPVRQGNADMQVNKYAKMGEYFAVVRNFTIEIYTNTGFLSKQPPIYTVQRGNDMYWTVGTDGTRFYAAKQMNSGKLAITTINVNNGTVSEFTTTPGGSMNPTQLEAHEGYLTVYGGSDLGTDVFLFKLLDGTPERIDLNQWVTKYYAAPPTGYVRPPSDQTTFYHAAPLKVDGKVYIIMSIYGLGDVIEIKSADGITASRVGPHATGDVFYGDTVDFSASTAVGAPAKQVTWDFGNPEGAQVNSAVTTTPGTTSHTYSGITSTVPVSRTVWARAAGAESSVSVTLKPPTARFRILGSTDLLFTQPNASSPAPIVLGDVFVDVSDGDVTGHLTTWTLDGVADVKTAGSSKDVGGCGQHTLNFLANYGVVNGNLVTGSYPLTISPFVYSVRPFAAAMTGPVSLGNALQFTSAGRPSTAHPSTSLINQWDLVDANNQVLFAGPVNA
ncbi:MAG TPA: hypothetical protein VFM36_13695, partial [Thermoanaerobaculia bacterium]|nr:hypothetical protein [Thermoanaerobaculia bacterium]